MTIVNSRFRLLFEWLFIAVISVGLLCFSARNAATALFDNALLDHAATVAASPAARDILIVEIDNRSLAEQGQWPWLRGDVARMVDRLSEGGARLIELDILFPEPTTFAEDQALADALARAGNVYLPIGFAQGAGDGADLRPLAPIAPLARSAGGTGHAALAADEDGHIRRIDPVVTANGARFAHLQVAVAAALGSPCGSGVCGQAGQSWIVPFRTSGGYRTVSASSILRGEVPAAILRDAVVLVGATATGLGDTHYTAHFGDVALPGVEIQANMLQAIREGGLIRPGGWPEAMGMGLALLLIQFVAFRLLTPGRYFLLTLSLIGAAIAFSVVLLVAFCFWLPPGPAIVAVGVAYPLWSWRRLTAVSAYLVERADRLAISLEAPAGKDQSGLDDLARQISKLDFLVEEVSQRRTFLKLVIETAPDAICVFGPDDRLLLMNRHAQALLGEGRLHCMRAEMLAELDALKHSRRDDIWWGDGRVFTRAEHVSAYDMGKGRIRLLILTDVTVLRMAEQERQQMLEVLSHDMRSPQVAILSLANAGGGHGHDDEQFDRIRSHARQTLSLADNFVQLARLSEVELQVAEHDLGALIEETADRAWALAQEKGVTIETRQGNGVFLARCDGAVIVRVLDNLIGNAVKYCPQGSHIVVSVNDAGKTDAVAVEVSDNGPGLPMARRNDPFVRFGARSSKGGGAGLGLAFVAKAVEQHGGTIDCACPPQGGTRFRIVLPGLKC